MGNKMNMETRIANTGEVHWHDNKPYFLFGHGENGFIFKDYEAYKNDWDAPCYVPENAGEDALVHINGIIYECGGSKDKCDWYSHNDLLKICRYNSKLCDCLFDTIDWCYPETWIEESDNNGTLDYNYVYDFVQVGSKVYWEDPDGSSSGFYEVVSINDGNEEWGYDTIVLIANEYLEAEAFLRELTPSNCFTKYND